MFKSFTGKVNVKKEINKRLRRVIGDSDPNRRESFINDNDQPGPGIPNNNPNDDKKVDDEEAKNPTDLGSNDYNSANKATSFSQRGSQMVKDSKEGYKMVKQEFGKMKKSATGYMKSTDNKEQAKNAYDYAQLH